MTGRAADQFNDMPENERGIYSIGTVARMYDIHQQSLRQYERLGLLVPNRTSGNTRMYSKHDIEKLETILSLTQDMGVNLAGVEIVLKLKNQIFELQSQMQELLNRVREHVEQDYEDRMRGMIEETAIVPLSKSRGIERVDKS
jgi:MerR family transcriptional regulator, heat shock protein HspR